ncbi:hypothetical protein ACLCDV_15645 [Sphingobacterium sp. Lzh-3]
MASYEISDEFGLIIDLPKTRCKEDNTAQVKQGKKEKSNAENWFIL